jgi:hypothetical protein
VRRAAFIAWGKVKDTTDYVFEPIGEDDADYARFDDVRSVGLAIATAANGLDAWLGNALSSPLITDRAALRANVGTRPFGAESSAPSIRRQMIDFHCHLDSLPGS